MNLHTLQLTHFRNYQSINIDFHPKVNVIVGRNAQGKTNLLEAISYLSGARSHRARFDRDLIQFDQPRATISARFLANGRDVTLEAVLQRGTRRQLSYNGVKLKTLGELSGLLPSVLFCPEDLHLVREGAGVRRRFLNDCICQLRPRYANALSEYRRLLEHKTRILRDAADKHTLMYVLDDYSTRLAQCGAILISYRAHFVKRLNECAPLIHADCSGGETLGLDYQTVSTVTDPQGSQKAIYAQLLEHQASHRKAELESRTCLSGPHKDDLMLTINGTSAKDYASQGQTRTAALSLKLAAREIFFEETGHWPLLLLDDVLSELDRRRQEFILNRIDRGQVFVTCCEVEKKELLLQGQVFHIENGSLC